MRTVFRFVTILIILATLLTVFRKTFNQPFAYTFQHERHQAFVAKLHKLSGQLNISHDELAAELSAMDSPQGYKISSGILQSRQGKFNNSASALPTIYVITPTYQRYTQIPDLTRLGQTLLNVPNLYWIVAEDANATNKAVLELLKALGIPYTYLLTPMPQMYREPKYSRFKKLPKGVANRNAGMDWIRNHATTGVFYMADDDNSYDIRLFEEIRYTQKVSMFPVGLVTYYGLSTPVLKDGKFIGWYDGWMANRTFPVDMAGFAVSVPFLLTRPQANMPFIRGREETLFLESLNITVDDIQFLADGCTKIYVWHTKTKEFTRPSRQILKQDYEGTNLRILEKTILLKGS